MPVKSVPTVGWTRGTIEATIRLVTSQQRQALAQRVRAEMERQNLDNVRLSRKAKISEKTISRIINAKLAPRYSTVERLSVGLGLAPDELWQVLGAEPELDISPDTPDLSKPTEADTDRLDAIEQRLGRIEMLLSGQSEADGVDVTATGVVFAGPGSGKTATFIQQTLGSIRTDLDRLLDKQHRVEEDLGPLARDPEAARDVLNWAAQVLAERGRDVGRRETQSRAARDRLAGRATGSSPSS